MLATAFRVFEISCGSQVGEVDLLEELFFRYVLVHGKEIWAKDEEEALPLLKVGVSINCTVFKFFGHLLLSSLTACRFARF